MQGYPMGSAPPPGAGGYGPPPGQWGAQPGAGGGQWPGSVGYGQPAPPASNHYGNYGQQFHQNAFALNTWQVSVGGQFV